MYEWSATLVAAVLLPKYRLLDGYISYNVLSVA